MKKIIAKRKVTVSTRDFCLVGLMNYPFQPKALVGSATVRLKSIAPIVLPSESVGVESQCSLSDWSSPTLLLSIYPRDCTFDRTFLYKVMTLLFP